MQLQGEQLIHAPRPRVWDALNDAGTLARCIPGCEELQRLSDTEIEARLLAKVGPVRARFGGRVLMSDIVVNERCTLRFEGQGGAAGMASGESRVTLLDDGGATRLQYSVQATVGGKLGQIGSRLIDASARKLADDFFSAFNEQLAPPAPAVAATAPAVAPAAVGAAVTAPIINTTRPHTGPGSDWSAELQRLLWLGVGLGLGLLGSGLLHR